MRRIVGLILIAVLVLSAAGCSSRSKGTPKEAPKEAPKTGAEEVKEQQKFKVAFVEFAPASGSSWVRVNVEGQEYAKKQLPWLEVTTVESVPEDPSSIAVIRRLAQEGNKVIFTDSFGYSQFVPDIAKEFPNTVFINQQAPLKGPNVGSFYGYLPEARYVEGVIAGLVTKTNTIGFAGAYPFPIVISGLNAFTLGARSVNPKAEVKVTWVNSWYDPAKEKEAADALMNAGADVIANHTDSDAILKAAAAKGKLAFSSSADWSKSAPEAFLTSNLWNWGPYFVKIITDIKDGKFVGGTYYWGSMKDGVVQMAPFGPAVDAKAKEAAEKAIAGIKDGSLQIFKGPLKDNTGKLRVKDGEVVPLSDAQEKLDWLIEGVKGSTK